MMITRSISTIRKFILLIALMLFASCWWRMTMSSYPPVLSFALIISQHNYHYLLVCLIRVCPLPVFVHLVFVFPLSISCCNLILYLKTDYRLGKFQVCLDLTFIYLFIFLLYLCEVPCWLIIRSWVYAILWWLINDAWLLCDGK